ncbi:hypothetical protein ACFE04_029655 [Oxalis oulophora]
MGTPSEKRIDAVYVHDKSPEEVVKEREYVLDGEDQDWSLLDGDKDESIESIMLGVTVAEICAKKIVDGSYPLTRDFLSLHKIKSKWNPSYYSAESSRKCEIALS